jgi:hypothetical protein
MMKMKPVLLAVLCLLSLVTLSSAVLRAGVSKIDGSQTTPSPLLPKLTRVSAGTLPDKGGVGVPLAGFNHGERRFSWWPLFNTGFPPLSFALLLLLNTLFNFVIKI